MKIWQAELALRFNLDEQWETRFTFELQPGDFTINEKFNEWTYHKDWLVDRIPMDMIVERCGYEGFKIVQGFDYEVTEEELHKIETRMRKLMRKQLDFEKENYLKKYEKMLGAV